MQKDRKKADAPYEPEHKGFDVETTRRAQATADRAREGASARGMDANSEYVDEGPEEAARRTGDSAERIGGAIEEASKRKR